MLSAASLGTRLSLSLMSCRLLLLSSGHSSTPKSNALIHSLDSFTMQRVRIIGGSRHSAAVTLKRGLSLLLLLAVLLACYTLPPASAARSQRFDSSHRKHKHKSAAWSTRTADPDVYRGATAKPMPTAEEIPIAELPPEFSWCHTPQGRSFCGPSWNQHIPQSAQQTHTLRSIGRRLATAAATMHA